MVRRPVQKVDMEQWKDIPGWEGFYQASNAGRVRSIDRVITHARWGNTKYKGRILKAWQSQKDGYYLVNLCSNKKRKSYYIHQLILLTFVGEPKPGEQVLHGDAGPFVNTPENLRWGTSKQNSRDYHNRRCPHCGKRPEED